MALINKLSAIGNAIREKTGKTDLLTLDQMPQEIKDIETSSGENWYDTFWDAFQYSDGRLNYVYAFYGYGWTDVTFKPKYDLKPTNATAMFSSTQIKNVKKCLEDAGVVLDTSKCTNFNLFTATSSITHLPCISFEGIPTGGNTSQAFTNATKLEYIEKIITRSDIVWNAYIFQSCASLKTIAEIEGEIGTNLNMSNCYNLDYDTIQRIINALADLTGATAQTLTLHATPKGKLTEEQIASITSKNWTLA